MSFPDLFGKVRNKSLCICDSGFLPQVATKEQIIIGIDKRNNKNNNLFQNLMRFGWGEVVGKSV